MSATNKTLGYLFDRLLSEHSREQTERFILTVSIICFSIHLALIAILKLGFLDSLPDSNFLTNPIAAVYTPFSFILLYEVYLLIYFLPLSFTTYITKQYEIITLIIIRNLFKDLAALELSTDWFNIEGDLQFTYDLIASIILFYLIYLFKKQAKRFTTKPGKVTPSVKRFVFRKKIIAILLIPLFLIMLLYNLLNWSTGIIVNSGQFPSFESANNLFFDQFFTVLILVDVVLLLFSFFYTDRFHKIIRNSGFIISTILIRMSFGVNGLISTALILVAVIFGLLIIYIHNKYIIMIAEEERRLNPPSSS